MVKIGLLLFVTVCLCACANNNAQSNPDKEKLITTTTDSNPQIAIDTNIQKITKMDIDSSLTPEYLMGKFDPSKDPRFVKISPPFSSADMYGRKEMFESFKLMQAAAKKDKINFTIVSATRTYDMQKAIWEGKWNSKKPVDGKILPPLSQLSGKERALKILLWNSMPSTSRHHWGTDIDINSVSPAYFAAGKGLKEYEWLVAHAAEYGFCQTYSEFGESRQTGYQVEKWHWSYMPIAQECTKAYPVLIKNEDIKGFVGAEMAVDIDIIKNYVLGINKACTQNKK